MPLDVLNQFLDAITAKHEESEIHILFPSNVLNPTIIQR